MKGYKENLEKITEENSNFRHVLYTGKHMQLVLMALLPGEEIGLEVHNEGDQFFRFESGEGMVLIDGMDHAVAGGDVVIVPAGAKHNIINTSKEHKLKLYTIYAPPHHKDGVIRATKSEAEADAPEFDGGTSE